jgi:tetratricopeptide (TPR) repeat protein
VGFFGRFEKKKEPKESYASGENLPGEKSRPIEAFEKWRIGDLIDNRFEIIRIIPGGMGVVYVCVDQTGFPYAVKTFQDKYLLDEESRKSFVREADTWIRLEKHRNIVKAFFTLKLSGKPYIFLEYVPSSRDGKANLRDYLLSLDLAKALNLAVQFCDGMIYANNKDLGEGRRGIVHRDIKPANIMLTQNGVLKITDFGLVKTLGAPSEERLIGTPRYMSPEQFETMDVDSRADIYSFGVVLYEMLTGQPPFWTEEEEDWYFCKKHHRETQPRPPRQINPDVSRELENIVLRCLEKKPQDRYRSFQDLRKALDDMYFEVSGERVTVQAGPPLESWELTYKGTSLVELGRLDEGIAILKQAIQLDPNEAVAHGNLGNAYYDKGLLDQAIAEYKRAVELDPNNALAHNNLGLAYCMKGWIDQAINELKRAIELNPNHALAHDNLGIAYRSKGWADQAIAEHRRAVELNPNYRAAHNNLALVYEDKGLLDQAIAEYKRAIELDPNNALARVNLGNAYRSKGWIDQAITELKWAIELDPNNALAHNILGLAYRSKGWIDQAITELKRAIELDPDLSVAHSNLGLAYEDKGLLDQAITEYKRAIELNPNDARAHLNLGNAYFRKGWADQAIAEYKRAIELTPNDAFAHNNLGNVYDSKGRTDQAITEYKRAIELNPNYAIARVNLGNTYRSKGWADQAITEYKRAIELNPNFSAAHFLLAVAYYGSRRFDLAWKHVRMAEKLGFPTQNIVRLVAALRNVSREH